MSNAFPPLTLASRAAAHAAGPRRLAVRAPAYVMAALFSSALGVGYILLPGDSERIAMLERDGKTKEARQILEAGFAHGDRRQRTLFQLQELYEGAGDLPKARQMLELLAQQRPRDVALQRQLGTFYRQTHDEPAYIGSLLAQINLRYSEVACREVIGLLRRSGAYDTERAALDRCRQGGYRRPEDMVRLASLNAADGDIREASVLLRAVDDLRRLKSERERLQLFQLLIESGQPNEAERRGARWVRAPKDDALALTLISELVSTNHPDLAVELARETSVPGDAVFLAIPEIMIERSQTTAALGLLRGWLEKATIFTPDVAQRFAAAALAVGAPDLALTCVQRVGIGLFAPNTVADIANGLDAVGRKPEGDALRAETGLAPGSVPPRDTGRGPLRDKLASGQAFRVVGLETWRADLWKRLIDENKPHVTPAASAAAVAPGHAARPLRGFKALKAAKQISSYRRKHEAAPAKPAAPSLFNFFGVKSNN